MIEDIALLLVYRRLIKRGVVREPLRPIGDARESHYQHLYYMVLENPSGQQ